MVETNLHESNGSVAFVSCGHPAMVDELRYFCSKMSITPKRRVDFYEQVQVWT